MFAKPITALAAMLALAAPAAASASEIFGGIYAHDVDLVTRSGIEDGVDLELGWRGERLGSLRGVGSPSPYLLASVNTSGDTHFAAAGLSWKIGDKVYVRPGIGLALHTGPSQVEFGEERIDFGSRLLFAPELGIGVQASDRLSVEASWVHLSHATLFSNQNPGLDMIGMRLNYRLR